MQIIHFTRNATDRLDTHDATGADFVPLANGAGETHIGCAHLDPDAIVEAPPLTHASTLLVVHGRITLHQQAAAIGFVSAGMGCVLQKGEPYTIKSATGAIVLIVECDQLEPHTRGISSPQRIIGATWPSDALLA